MSNTQINQQQLDEHDNNTVPAKRVKNYVFNPGTGVWEKQTSSSNVSERYDYSNSNTIYTATAAIGTADSDPDWTITKYDLTDSSDASGKVAYSAVWDDRTTETYL